MFLSTQRKHFKTLSNVAVRNNGNKFFKYFGTTNEETEFILRRSNLFCPIDKNLHPDDKMVKSNQLMIQAGLIAKSSPGVFTLLPLGLRAIEKLTKVIDDEMKKIGGQKVHMPTLIPSSLWRQSGRLESAGPELMKFKDRKGHLYCLGPTHEEVVTDLVHQHVNSFKQLPLKIYQITSKFRDEVRPRFGLMRGREFIMKDMYSFDLSQEGAYRTYEQAYNNIFKKLSFKYAVAEADSGTIGGNKSEEFHVLSDIGEDLLLHCDTCNYVSNVEKAVGKSIPEFKVTLDDLQYFSGTKTEVVAIHIDMDKKEPKQIHAAVVIRDNRVVNHVKIQRLFGADEIKSLNQKEAEEIIKNDSNLQLLVDSSIGTLEKSKEISNNPLLSQIVKKSQSFKISDVRNAMKGDGCPNCTGHLKEYRGIEVGHIFYLGTKYSKPLNAKFKTREGEEKIIEMGCYGLGVGRILASCIEVMSDEHGLVFPRVIAPYQCIVVPIGQKGDNSMNKEAIEIYKMLEKNGFEGEVVLDDREDSPGFRMNDARFLGFPFTIVVGKSWQQEKKLELQIRKTNQKVLLTKDELISFIQKQ